MISLPLSEAFCYDMLAIASIKASFNPHNQQAATNMDALAIDIARQVGYDRHNAVVASPEYRSLLRVNREMYMRIDELKARGEQIGDAVYIDDRVYQRFLAKQALQKRWFPEEPLTEQKMGYESVKGSCVS